MVDVTKHNNEVLKKFYEEHQDSVVEIPVSEIHLRDKSHLNTYKLKNVAKLVHGIKENNGTPNGIIIVNKTNKGYYVLISGLKWFKIAKLLNSNIKCIVIEDRTTHLGFNEKYGVIEISTKQPDNIEKYIHYKDIVILDKMKNRKPSKEKKAEKFNQYTVNKGILKSIEVRQRPDGKYALIDGYISYLWLKENKERWIPIKTEDEIMNI